MKKDLSGLSSSFCTVLGAQWGDEGKGKLVDTLGQHFQLCARFNGGSNAGHTLVVDGKRFSFHLLPCGIINRECRNLIGSGVVVHLPTLMQELEELRDYDPRALQRVFISTRAHILLDCHQLVDCILEAERGADRIGTTKRGIGPCYASKALRNGLRISDLLHPDSFETKLRELVRWSQQRYGSPSPQDSQAVAQLRAALRAYDTRAAFSLAVPMPMPMPMPATQNGVSNLEAEVERYRTLARILRPQLVEGVSFLHDELAKGTRVLVEGANAALLDVDFGTYPFVTSSTTTIGGVLTGLGVPPKVLDTVIGVVKAYTTRVGSGPFPTELQDGPQSLADHEVLYTGKDFEGTRTPVYSISSGTMVKVGELLQEVGLEYGTTTGRRRRCGWLDIPLLLYGSQLNGYDSLCITKLDVLTGLSSLRIAVAYRSKAAPEVRLPACYFPSHLEDLSEIECEYETLEGWSEDITGCRSFGALPPQAQKYLLRVQELVKVPISWVGVGPGRENILRLDFPLLRTGVGVA